MDEHAWVWWVTIVEKLWSSSWQIWNKSENISKYPSSSKNVFSCTPSKSHHNEVFLRKSLTCKCNLWSAKTSRYKE